MSVCQGNGAGAISGAVAVASADAGGSKAVVQQ
jgi:hypothetical protein